MDNVVEVGPDGRHFSVRLKCVDETGRWDGRVLGALVLHLADAGYDFEVIRDEASYATVRSRDGDFANHLKAALKCPEMVAFLERHSGSGVHEFGFSLTRTGCELSVDGYSVVYVDVYDYSAPHVYVYRMGTDDASDDHLVAVDVTGGGRVTVPPQMVRTHNPRWKTGTGHYFFQGRPPEPAKED